MNSKNIGNIGEVKALAAFTELGIPVYLPFGDNEKEDMIAKFNGRLNRIQVKTSIKAKDGKMKFDITSNTKLKGKNSKYVYTSEDIDYFVFYNIEREKIFLVDVNETASTGVTIRYDAPKNNQTKGVKYEKDYLLENVIAKINEVNQEQVIF